jgi:hypothetical protein
MTTGGKTNFSPGPILMHMRQDRATALNTVLMQLAGSSRTVTSHGRCDMAMFRTQRT